MSLVTTHYRTWATRHRRRAGATALEIAPATTTTVTNPGIYQTVAFPTISWFDGNGQIQSANFAFWSVTGTSASIQGIVATDPQLSINVAGDNMTAVAWYIPVGSGPGTGTGIDIDAFDVNAGEFVLDDFVKVTSDSSLTTAANWDGFVPTTSAQTIEAFASISVGPFIIWDIVMGGLSKSARNLSAPAGSNGIAFAFYQKQPPSGGIKLPHDRYRESVWVSHGVMVDGGGPTGGGPVGPWDPLFGELMAGLNLANSARMVDKELRAGVLEIAAKQVLQSAEKMARNMKTIK
ncbi:MAG: hypothetical protein ABI644_02280 [Arenimonas sp.]